MHFHIQGLLVTLDGIASRHLRQHWDDAATLLVLTIFLYIYAQSFLLPPKYESGYEQFFVAPQVVDGLTTARTRRKKETRSIAQKLRQSVSTNILQGTSIRRHGVTD